jgi:Ca-activated chloride channel family protein
VPQIARAPTPGLQLTARLAPGAPPLTEGIRWRIRKEGATSADAVREAEAAQASVPLPPGRYLVEALANSGASWRRTIDVPAGARTLAPFDLGAGSLVFAAPLATGGLSVADAVLEIRASDNAADPMPLWLGQISVTPLILKAGRYDARITAGDVHKQVSVEVAAGDVRTIETVLSAGLLTLDTADGGDGSDAGSAVEFIVEADDPKSPGGRRTVARAAGRQPSFVLPAGTYYVSAREGLAMAQELIAVPPGARVARTLDLGTMELRLKARLMGNADPAGKTVHFTVWRTSNDLPIGESEAVDPVFRLTPGRYRVRSRIGHQNAIMVREFEVTKGEAGEILLEHKAGTVKLTLDGGPPAGGRVYWRVLDADGRPVWRTTDARPLAILKAGTYIVLADLGRAQYRDTVVVTSGQHVDLKLGAQQP